MNAVTTPTTTTTPLSDPLRASGHRRWTGWRSTAARDGTGLGWIRLDPPTPQPSPAVPVVLCNGIACSIDYWHAMVEPLRRSRPVVLWDYRGHGVSDVPADPSAVTVADVVDDLTVVLRAAGVGRAVLIGHSYGVQVALEAADRRPGRVAGLVAIAGSAGRPLPAGATRPPLGVLHLLRVLHEQLPEPADAVWRRWWRSPMMHLAVRAMGGTSVAAPSQVMQAYYEHVSTREVTVLLSMMHAMQDHDASAAAARLRVPLLALAGDADRLTSVPTMARFALAAPDGQLAVCHGATHTLPAERPGWVLDQVAPLLRDIDAADRGHAAHAADPVGIDRVPAVS